MGWVGGVWGVGRMKRRGRWANIVKVHSAVGPCQCSLCIQTRSAPTGGATWEWWLPAARFLTRSRWSPPPSAAQWRWKCLAGADAGLGTELAPQGAGPAGVGLCCSDTAEACTPWLSCTHTGSVACTAARLQQAHRVRERPPSQRTCRTALQRSVSFPRAEEAHCRAAIRLQKAPGTSQEHRAPAGGAPMSPSSCPTAVLDRCAMLPLPVHSGPSLLRT